MSVLYGIVTVFELLSASPSRKIASKFFLFVVTARIVIVKALASAANSKMSNFTDFTFIDFLENSKKVQKYFAFRVTACEKEAFAWFVKAGKAGHPSAQFKVGTLSKDDDKEAFSWFTKAAEQGDANAQYGVGLCYKYGDAVPRNKAKASEWLKKASDNGHDLAHDALDDL